MDTATIEALKKSIESWKKKTKQDSPYDVSMGPTACALCRVYYRALDMGDRTCLGCPVMKVTSRTRCENSPYTEALDRYHDWITAVALHRAPSTTTRLRGKFRTAAKAEVKFLESLMPKEA